MPAATTRNTPNGVDIGPKVALPRMPLTATLAPRRTPSTATRNAVARCTRPVRCANRNSEKHKQTATRAAAPIKIDVSMGSINPHSIAADVDYDGCGLVNDDVDHRIVWAHRPDDIATIRQELGKHRRQLAEGAGAAHAP